MNRLAVLLALLAAPLAARAQPLEGSINFRPDTAIGAADCASTTAEVGLTWTIQVTTGGNTVGAFYELEASNSADCPDTDLANGKQSDFLARDIPFEAATQSYPSRAGDSPILVSNVLRATGYTCASPDSTIYFCVAMRGTGGNTILGRAQGTVKLQLAPPVAPVSVGLAPGERALTVSWQPGEGGATAVRYRIEAQSDDPAQDPKLHVAETINTRYRLEGLVNLAGGAVYRVVVYAISEGGNLSPASDPAFDSPEAVLDFWEYYSGEGGRDSGGCGGPAGALSLAGLAVLALVARRRP